MDTTIHEYLQERRIEMKLSIQQLSQESGISASHISRMERGLRTPSPKTLEKLAPFLRVEYITLLKIANLLNNPQSNCVDFEKIIKDNVCVYREKEIPPYLKEKILELLYKELK